MIPITWPFAVWGLDLVGPLKRAPGSYTHLLIAVDKFTKWLEAQSISMIKFEQAMQFFLDIVHRFGIPNSIITDNAHSSLGRNSSGSVMTTTSMMTGPP